jgi:F-type H+-transporting ATPase subunit gamma
MSDTLVGLRRKLNSAGELQSVVRSMKALSASSIGQYEKSTQALTDYYRTVELGLSVCFREMGSSKKKVKAKKETNISGIAAIVFGSDQGLVGQFNEIIADFAIQKLKSLPGKSQVWCVGERVHARLLDAGLPISGIYKVPNSVKSIAPLIGQIQIKSEAKRAVREYASVYVFHNRQVSSAAYEPVVQRLLPLDEIWRQSLIKIRWPTRNLPQVMDGVTPTLHALIHEYLFISLFRACAESLASENASRLSAMERAEKNIEELLEKLNGEFHRLRQDTIDEELFDVVSGFEAQSEEKKS